MKNWLIHKLGGITSEEKIKYENERLRLIQFDLQLEHERVSLKKQSDDFVKKMNEFETEGFLRIRTNTQR